MDDNRICVGAIAGSFGVKGEVRLKSFCAEPASISDYGPLSARDRSKDYKIKNLQPIKSGFAALLSGVESKEQADSLRGTELFVDRDKLPALPDDEFYHSDLTGLDVLDTGGSQIGKVKSIQNHGAGDLVEILLASSSNTILIPFTRQNVPTVDLASNRIILDAPDGSLPDV